MNCKSVFVAFRSAGDAAILKNTTGVCMRLLIFRFTYVTQSINVNSTSSILFIMQLRWEYGSKIKNSWTFLLLIFGLFWLFQQLLPVVCVNISKNSQVTLKFTGKLYIAN